MQHIDPADGLSVLHVVVRATATNSQYNEHCLPVMRHRRITVCSLFPADVAAPPELRMVEGDGSVRGCFHALRQALATSSYDVVHVHAPASAVLTLAVYLWTRRPRRDLVFTMHSSWSRFRPRDRLFLYVIAPLFPVFVTCGESSAASLPRRIRILSRCLEVVPNGVDIDRVDRVLAARSGRSRQPDREGLEVATVGRLIPLKDPATVMEAFVGAAGPRDRLVVVGDGELAGKLAAAVLEAGLEDRIHLTGGVPRDEVYRVLDRAATFVSASTVEGLPVSVLEAMACRCPVVLSDIPAHRDIARLAPDIPLVPVSDVAGFREAIAQQLKMSPSGRQRIGDALRRCVAEHFSVTGMNDGYGRVYRGLAQRNGRPAAPVGAQPRTVPRVASLSVAAAVLGMLAALGYGATHPPAYSATTTLAVGEVATAPTEDQLGLGAADATTVADLVRRQVVLQPVAQSLSLGDWRTLQRQVSSRVGDNPLFVEVSVTAASPGAAERLADAVAQRVLQLTATDAWPALDPMFVDRELARIGDQVHRTQAGIDRVLHRMDAAGPEGASRLGRQLTTLHGRLVSLQDASQALLDRRSQPGPAGGVTVEDVAYAHRQPWPPAMPALAGLGAVGGLGALVALSLLTGPRRQPARGAATATRLQELPDSVPDLVSPPPEPARSRR